MDEIAEITIVKTRKKRRKMPRVQPLPALRYLEAWLRLDAETGALYHKRKCRGYQIGDRADYPTERGYRRITLYYAGKTHNFAAHRIIYKMYHRVEVPVYLVIDHDNRVRDFNVPGNLILTTTAINNLNRTLNRVTPY